MFGFVCPVRVPPDGGNVPPDGGNVLLNTLDHKNAEPYHSVGMLARCGYPDGAVPAVTSGGRMVQQSPANRTEKKKRAEMPELVLRTGPDSGGQTRFRSSSFSANERKEVKPGSCCHGDGQTQQQDHNYINLLTCGLPR